MMNSCIMQNFQLSKKEMVKYDSLDVFSYRMLNVYRRNNPRLFLM